MVRASKEAWAGAVSNRDELHQTKREAILRMAARMFANEGYAATSLNAIAERLNVTKPTLYYYIENKEAILNACVAEGLTSVEENLAAAHATGANGYEKLALFFRLHVNFILNDFGALLVAARQDLTVQHKRQLKIVDRAVIELIDEATADGSMKPCDSKIACFALFGAFNAIPLWFRDAGDKTSANIVDMYFDMFTNGLAAP